MNSHPWLFSPRIDLATFGGSALVAFVLLAIGGWAGLLQDGETPEWTWIPTILLIDVAHVYATCFRVYFVKEEFARRRWLYVLAPTASFAVAAAIYSEGPRYFWTALAYVAVFHFIRQQYGWVALYRAKGGETGRVGRWIDTAAIYLATLYPLVYWHSHLPRRFWWFVEGDFLTVPSVVARLCEPLYWGSLAAYFARSMWRGFRHGQWSAGKDLVVLTTALCWYVGIVVYNSDYAFTVTNVVIHGIPYLVLVYWYYRGPAEADRPWSGTTARRIAVFVGTIWVLAYTEELLWDRGVWHERAWLFGPGWHTDQARGLLVPLLAVPQLTHYILDGFIWRRRSNPALTESLELPDRGSAAT